MTPLERARAIYVRLPNWIGDVVLATPLLRALRRAAPRAEVALHGRGAGLALLATEGLHDRELLLGPARGPLGPWREGRRVRAVWRRPDLALLLPNSVSSALVALGAGARERVGYALNGRGPLLTRALPVARQGRLRPVPMVDYYLGLLEAAGGRADGVARRPALGTTPAREARAAAAWDALALDPGRPVWAINVGAAWETKRWPPAHVGELVRRLDARGVQALLLRGPDEGDLARACCEAAGRAVPGADRVIGLGELVPVLRRCALLVTTDSGPRHVGVAAGLPVVAVIGPTHPAYTAVDSDRVAVVCEEVDCWPCHLPRCPVDFRCMTRLLPARVLGAADALLARVGPGPGGPPGQDPEAASAEGADGALVPVD